MQNYWPKLLFHLCHIRPLSVGCMIWGWEKIRAMMEGKAGREGEGGEAKNQSLIRFTRMRDALCPHNGSSHSTSIMLPSSKCPIRNLLKTKPAMSRETHKTDLWQKLLQLVTGGNRLWLKLHFLDWQFLPGINNRRLFWRTSKEIMKDDFLTCCLMPQVIMSMPMCLSFIFQGRQRPIFSQRRGLSSISP